MNESPLSRIAQILDDEDFAVHFLPATEEAPVDSLYVHLFEDDEERPHVLQLLFTNDVANAVGVPDDPDDAVYLQLTHVMPFKVPAERHAEVAFLLFYLNRLLPSGAFGLSDTENVVFYRDCVTSPDREVDEIVAVESVSTANFFIELFSPEIEAVATGETTRKDVIEKLTADGMIAAPVLPFPGIE